MTTFGDQLFQFGGVPVGPSGSVLGGLSLFGDHWFVDFLVGDDANEGKKPGPTGAFKTLSRAYAAATSGNNDLIWVNGNSAAGAWGTVEEDAMLTWAKNKIHVVGCGAFGRTDQSPRIIFSTTGISSVSAAVLKVTGWANTFTNFRINSWGTDNANVCALWDAGEATTYINCQFNKFTDLNVTTVSDVEARGDSTTWLNCKFGFDTLLQTVARPTLWIKGTGGSARMKNNYFLNPWFCCQCDDNTKNFVNIYDTNSLAFGNIMVNPIFNATVITSTGAVILTDAVESVSGLGEGNLLIVNPAHNCTALCTDDTTRIQVVGPGTSTTAGAPQTPA